MVPVLAGVAKTGMAASSVMHHEEGSSYGWPYVVLQVTHNQFIRMTRTRPRVGVNVNVSPLGPFPKRLLILPAAQHKHTVQ